LTSSRFSRQECVPGVDQSKIESSSALVVGAGGLGSPVVMYLAASGLCVVDVVDHDVVEESNLHRQILYSDRDLGGSKALLASSRARAVGASSSGIREKFDHSEVLDYDVILDCTDRWSSHDSVISAGLKSGIPVVHGSVQGTLGRVMVFRPGGPCWRCLHPESPPGVKDGPRGTLGPVCGVVGSMMAMEALKVILEWDVPPDRMDVYDARSGQVTSLPRSPDPSCRCRSS
jgi:molybdopterin/thiamine biosynthesis adenylyltransferase